jgi:hypothetical protein
MTAAAFTILLLEEENQRLRTQRNEDSALVPPLLPSLGVTALQETRVDCSVGFSAPIPGV